MAYKSTLVRFLLIRHILLLHRAIAPPPLRMNIINTTSNSTHKLQLLLSRHHLRARGYTD